MEHIYIKKDSLRKIFILFLISIAFTAVFTWMIKESYLSDKTIVIKDLIIPIQIKEFTLGLIGLLFSASCVIAMVYFNFINKNEDYYNLPYIIINEKGLKIRNTKKFIKWEEVADINIEIKKVNHSTSKHIAIFLKDPYTFHSNQNKYFKYLNISINKYFGFASINIMDLAFVKNNKKITLEEILNLINQYYRPSFDN